MALHRSPVLDEAGLFAEYPFLPGAEALVEGYGASVGALLADPAYARARELGRRRILGAVDEPTAAPGAEELARAPAEERYLSFQYARLLLSTLGPRGALRRWAVAEAKGASARLGPSRRATTVEVARRLGFAYEEEGRGGLRLPLPDYLVLSAPLRDGEFRLVAQPVGDGWVRVDAVRGARLLQEGIRAALSRPLPLEAAVVEAIRASEGPFLDDVARRSPAPSARPSSTGGPLRPALFPPCVRHMQRVLQEGENLSHTGRFALAAFLYRAGASAETIVDAYRGAPDFDEGVTRYQVEHITQRDGGRGYEPPNCDSIRSHGLCFRDGDPGAREAADRDRDPRCFEPTLRHPMQYYRRRGGVPPEPGEPPEGPGRAA